MIVVPITGVRQPDVLPVSPEIRLRKFDGCFSFALDWYQDEETVYLVDGVRKAYSEETLRNMYHCLDRQGELYFIEVWENGGFVPIGDVAFWREDMPIVIGVESFRGKGIGSSVIKALAARGASLGYDCLYVREIYSHNTASRRCFERAGFHVCERTEQGHRFKLELRGRVDNKKVSG